MKFLVNPFFWCVLLQAAGLVVLQWRAPCRGRALLRVLLLLTLLLAVASTPLSGRGLETSLSLASSTSSAITPAFIFVLGGGYTPGIVPDEDILSTESLRRVLHGITLWRHTPHAHLVFSGAIEYTGRRELNRHAQLMAEAALHRGVPASAVLLEPRSHNTREYPVEALLLPNVTPATPIAVVTSNWHMRRAKHEFCRYFQHVQIDPVPDMQSPVVWLDFIPDAGSLNTNTTLLREWVGMLWYAILQVQT